MNYRSISKGLLASLLLVACGGGGGASAGDSSMTGTTGGGTSGEPTTAVTSGSTGGVTSGGDSSGGASQGQTDTGSGESSGAASTGETSTSSSTGEPGSSSTGEAGSSTGADLCADFVAPACLETGCPEGQECKVLPDVCVSSDCTCDAATGEIVCSPDCGGGSCVAACPDVLCDLFCENGFKLDRDGCEVCECNEPPACGCVADSDCVKVSSGCCPCNAGGNEVPAAESCIDQVMKCDKPPEEISCPQVFLCTDAQPACVQGQCVLQ